MLTAYIIGFVITFLFSSWVFNETSDEDACRGFYIAVLVSILWPLTIPFTIIGVIKEYLK